MRTRIQGLEKVAKLEHKLFLLTEKIGDILQKPVSKRDTSLLASTWLEIEESHSQMRSIRKSLQHFRRPARGHLTRREFRQEMKRYKQSRDFKKRLRIWNEMSRLVQRHIEPQKTPLLQTLQVNERDDLVNLLYRALHRLANPNHQDPLAQDQGCWPDIPMPILTFEKLMLAAYRIGLAQNPRRERRFLDVGCGGGSKVIAATRFFSRCDGLEYDSGYADAARRTLRTVGATNSSVIHADALTFDSYSDYDVIYFYRPVRSDELLEEMEQHIMREARPGTILVAPYHWLPAARIGLDCAMVKDPIFVIGVDQAEADQLRDDAEATGTAILRRSTDWNFDTGYWAPILDAASFNGVGKIVSKAAL